MHVAALDCVCAQGFTQCGFQCVDVLSSSSHCGACFDPCPADKICVAGSCERQYGKAQWVKVYKNEQAFEVRRGTAQGNGSRESFSCCGRLGWTGPTGQRRPHRAAVPDGD